MAPHQDSVSSPAEGVSLAGLVRALRERVPLSQEELAQRSGLSVGTIRGLESGRIHRPRSGSVRGLADALGLTDEDRKALVVVARGQHIEADGTTVRSVGRDVELAELRQAVADAAAGRGRAVLVVGEPGIGKTLLIEDTARYARHQGARVIVVRCPGSEGAPPYWPWSEALRACVGGAESTRTEVERLLPQISARPLIPVPATNDDSSRFELFHRVATVFHAAALRTPLILVLDDLHWADAPTLKLFELLASTVPTVPLLLVGTYRDVDVAGDHRIAKLAARLPGDTTRVELRGLGVDAVARLVAATARAEPAPPLVRWLHRHTGGNPLFAQEVVRLLVAEGRLDQPPRHLVLPNGVRGVIERRLHGFAPATAEVLRWAAVCGDEFDLALVERASDASKDEISRALAVARRSRLVRPLADRTGWYAFTHGLVAEALRDNMPPTDRARRHLRLGETLAGQAADGGPSPAAEISYHLVAALPEGNAVLASDYTASAAKQASQTLAWEEAVRLYDQALHALRLVAGTERRAAELLVERAAVAGRMGDGPEARQAALEAVEAARQHGTPLLLAQAALAFSARTFADDGDATTINLIEEALDRLPPEDSPTRSVLLARLAEEVHHLDRARFTQLTGEALAMAGRLDDPAARWEALFQKHRAQRGSADIGERIATSRELVDLAVQVGDHERTLLSRIPRVLDLITAGTRPSFDHEIEIFARTVERARLQSFRWFVPLWKGSRATAEGKLAEAEAFARDVLQLAVARGDYAMAQYAALLGGIRLQQCRVAEVEPAIAVAAERHPTLPVYRCALAVIHSELGQPASAHALLEPLAVDDFAAVPLDNEWALAAQCIAETCVALDRADWGRALYPRLLPYAHHHAVSSSGALYLGAAARSLGLLAAHAGDLDAADAHFRAALTATQRFGAPLWAAQTKLDWASLLAARGQPGDQESARRLVEEVRAFADEMDVPRLRQQLVAMPSGLR